jgi:hypothetical protein
MHTIDIKLAVFIEPLSIKKTMTNKETFVRKLRNQHEKFLFSVGRLTAFKISRLAIFNYLPN